MINLGQQLANVQIGTLQTVHNLTMFPLAGENAGEDGYITLDDALRQRTVRIDETSEAGSVPELRLVNDAEQPVLLIDGEELVGAKQNRILNLTILVAAKTTTVIPVSCVEAGRWSRRSATFGSAGRAHYAAGRAMKAEQVTRSLRERGDRRSDQSEIWSDISAKMSRMQAVSDTGAMSDLYEQRASAIDEFVERMTAQPGQTGAAFGIGSRLAGIDLFDHESTLRALLPKLVRSFALDAIDQPSMAETATPTADDVRALLSDIAAAPAERYAATGLGEDIRPAGERLVGTALAVDGRIVHLSAFPR